MRRALFAALALLAILFVAAPPPAIADTVKSGSEPIPILTVTITGDYEGTVFATWVTVYQDMTTWTSFQRGYYGLTITAIPSLATVPTATVLDLATPGALSGQPWRLADCTGTGTAHDGKSDTRKPTALIASTGGHIGQPLRR